MSKITEALSKLDPNNDNHWTQDGLPRLDTVKILAGNPSLTREAVTAAAPNFNRQTAQAAAQGAAQGGAATPVQGGGESQPQAAVQAAPAADGTVATPAPAAEPDLPVLAPAALAEPAGDVDELEQKLAEARLHLSDCQDRLQLAKQELEDAQNAIAELEAQLKETPKASSNPIQEYLARQRKNLEERAARKELIRNSGLDLSQLAKDLKSPLDAAMERRRDRGSARPVRGLR